MPWRNRSGPTTRPARNSINANPTLKRRCEATIARWERLADNDDPSLHATMEADVAAEKYPGAVPLFNGLLCERFRSPRNPRELEQVSVEWIKRPGQRRQIHQASGRTFDLEPSGSSASRRGRPFEIETL